jgi:hypothetical protein
MKPIAILIIGFLLSGFVFNLSSCRKETDCKALVKCVDSSGTAVNNANIFLFALVKSADGKTTYTGDVTATGNTDGSGAVNFTFKLPAIYDIRATLVAGTRTLSGLSIIKLEEGKTISKTVSIK